MRDLSLCLAPNAEVSFFTRRFLVVATLIVGLIFWLIQPLTLLPNPLEVLRAFGPLWFEHGLGQELVHSLLTNLEALGWTATISLGLAYLTVVPALRPIVAFVSKLRFLGIVGLPLIFTLIFGGGHNLKVSVLTFGVTAYFVTAMADVVAQIPREDFDHARTLRMSEWRVVWEVVVLGQFDRAIDVLRQNAAMGWMMITMVEGLVRSEGGVGALLLNENKHFHLAAVFAILIAILGVGLVQDYVISQLKRMLCPYAELALERR